MPWTREEKVLCVTSYLETKSFSTVQAKFRKNIIFNNYPQKSDFFSWVRKFQAPGSVNNLKKKAHNPRFCRKWTTKYPDSVDLVRDSVGSNPKTWSSTCIVAKKFLSRIFSCIHTESKSSTNSYQLTWSLLSQ